ncbi:MAG: hypothetical protein P1U54_10015 [Immundisolibacteraceae bacterium]|nr:hypothetical protein [Immundisolibacteraceae bacterium]
MSKTIPPAEGYSGFVAILLLAIAMIMMLVSQRIGLMDRQARLVETHQSQEQLLGQSKKVRSQFQAIMERTAQLADDGNQTALALLSELEKQGVKVRSNPGNPAAEEGS